MIRPKIFSFHPWVGIQFIYWGPKLSSQHMGWYIISDHFELLNLRLGKKLAVA